MGGERIESDREMISKIIWGMNELTVLVLWYLDSIAGLRELLPKLLRWEF
jgi:hypothetical protein